MRESRSRWASSGGAGQRSRRRPLVWIRKEEQLDRSRRSPTTSRTAGAKRDAPKRRAVHPSRRRKAGRQLFGTEPGAGPKNGQRRGKPVNHAVSCGRAQRMADRVEDEWPGSGGVAAPLTVRAGVAAPASADGDLDTARNKRARCTCVRMKNGCRLKSKKERRCTSLLHGDGLRVSGDCERSSDPHAVLELHALDGGDREKERGRGRLGL